MTLTLDEKREIFEQMRAGKFEPSDSYDERTEFADGMGTMQFQLGDHATYVVDDLIGKVLDLGVGTDDERFLAHMQAAIGDRVQGRSARPEYELLYWLNLLGRGATYDYKNLNADRMNAISRLSEALAWQIVEAFEGLDQLKVEAF